MALTQKRSVVIYNPVKVDVERLHQKVDAAVADYGWGPVTWVETTEDEPGESQAREAAASGVDMVVACGGDGTVRSVATGLRGTEAALGIFPQGTGNLLARNLGVPLDFHRSVRTAYAGRDREIDFCHADVAREDGSEERIHFAVMAGVGIDAQMIVNTDDGLKRRFGVLAYAVAIAKSLGGGDRIQVEHQVDDEETLTSKAHSVIVGNCGELVGAIQLIPDAEPDDGILDILVMRPKDLLGWGQIFGSIFWNMTTTYVAKATGATDRQRGTRRRLSTLRYETGKSFTARLSRPEVFEVDGDTVGTVTGFRIGMDSRALKVRVSA